MKKIIKMIKNNILGFIFGVIIAILISTYAATQLSSSSVYYDNTNSGGSYNTVNGAIDELYELAKTTEFKIGDYVQMTPEKTTFNIPKTLTGYTVDQTINPSELNLWRVIKINDDATVDMVSEYVSSTDIYFRGQTGYQNYIGTLNYIAKQYETIYTISSRHMGYDGTQTEYITDTSALTSTTAPQNSYTSSSNVTSETEARGLGDMGYETDYNIVKTALGTRVAYKVGTTTATTYWIASRRYYYYSTKWDFNGRCVFYIGDLNSYNMFYYENGSFPITSSSLAIRPIVTLKSGVKASNGDGSSASPYVLN